MKAGEIVGKIYESLLKQYKNPKDPDSLKSINQLCVRIVFACMQKIQVYLAEKYVL